MAEIHQIDELMPHVVVPQSDCVEVISISDIRMIASGQVSVAEYEDPEAIAKTLATIAIRYIDQ
jgi:hypothetical protein